MTSHFETILLQIWIFSDYLCHNTSARSKLCYSIDRSNMGNKVILGISSVSSHWFVIIYSVYKTANLNTEGTGSYAVTDLNDTWNIYSLTPGIAYNFFIWVARERSRVRKPVTQTSEHPNRNIPINYHINNISRIQTLKSFFSF